MNNRYVLSAIIVIAIFTVLFIVLTTANIYINSVKCHKCSLHGVQENYTNAQLTDMISAEETKQNGHESGFAGSGSLEFNPINTNYFNSLFNTRDYDPNIYDTQYHDSVDVIVAAGGDYGLPLGTVWVMDPCGNKVAMIDPNAKTNFTYYQPGAYSKYGSGNYVPSYTDSVYLSETLNFLRKSPYAK